LKKKKQNHKAITMKNFLFFFLFIPILLTAQSPKVGWERTFGSQSNDIAYDVIQTTNGDIAIVGEMNGNTSQGTDGLLVVLDNDGNSILETVIATKGNDGIRAAADIGNGDLMLAGYSEAVGKRSGWLVKVNFSGDVVWKKKYGKGSFNDFSDIVVNSKGNIVVTGTTNANGANDVWVAEMDKRGTVLWQKAFGGRKSDGGRAITVTDDGYVITGFTNSKGAGKTDVYVIKVDATGNVKWENTFGTKKNEEGFDIQITDNGFMVVGFNANTKNNALVINIDANGKKRWDKEFGGNNTDEAHTLVKTYDKNFAIAGKSRSTSRTNQMWFTQINANGQQQIKDSYYGGNQDEDVQAMMQASDGNLIAVGATNSDGLGGSDFLVMKLETGFKPKQLQPSDISVNIDFQDKNRNNALDATEEGLLKVEIKNNGEHDVYNLIGKVNSTRKIRGVRFSNKLNGGFLKAGVSKTLLLPIEASERVKSQDVDLNIVFTDENKSTISPASYTLKVEEKTQVSFKLSHQMEPAILGKMAIINLKVQNMGKKEASGYRLNFIGNRNIIPMSSNGMSLPALSDGGDFDATYKFEVNKAYPYPTIPIVCVVRAPNGDTTQYIAKVEVRSSIDADLYENVDVVVRWYTPDIDFYREKPLKISNERLKVKLKVESRKEYKREDLILTLNGKPYKDGSKFDEGSLIPAGKNRRQFHVFTFIDIVEFPKDGKYKVALQDKKTGETISDKLNVVYSGVKPNLYVLAVGTKTNLQYTMQDAKDFATLYNNQSGNKGLFTDIEVKSILGSDATASNILEAIEDMEIKSNTGVITPNDMIIIFMSSHGFMLRNEFYIQGDDYQTGRHRTKAVRYSEMMEILDFIPCKKLIFIDACHSGGAKGVSSSAVNDAISELNAQESGLTTIVSSDADELSYEDKAWKNGAFTEAIMKAMVNGKCDTDRNKIVTIDELFSYLRREVPQMVSKVKKQPQNPQMVSSGLNNVPIYILK
jgi:hypothetical protein